MWLRFIFVAALIIFTVSCSFHTILHVQHLIQLFPKGFILSSPFFFFLMEDGLFLFPTGNVDLLHAMLFLQDALGGIVLC